MIASAFGNNFDLPTMTTTLTSMPRLLYLTLALMILGTGLELVLLEHYEDGWQWVPVIIFGLALLLFVVLLVKPAAFLLRAFRGLMVLSMLSGFLGVYFHLMANWEFETELHPTYSTWDLLTNSLTGALPALAPGSMVVFGLLGIITSAHLKIKHT